MQTVIAEETKERFMPREMPCEGCGTQVNQDTLYQHRLDCDPYRQWVRSRHLRRDALPLLTLPQIGAVERALALLGDCRSVDDVSLLVVDDLEGWFERETNVRAIALPPYLLIFDGKRGRKQMMSAAVREYILT